VPNGMLVYGSYELYKKEISEKFPSLDAPQARLPSTAGGRVTGRLTSHAVSATAPIGVGHVTAMAAPHVGVRGTAALSSRRSPAGPERRRGNAAGPRRSAARGCGVCFCVRLRVRAGARGCMHVWCVHLCSVHQSCRIGARDRRRGRRGASGARGWRRGVTGGGGRCGSSRRSWGT
jgi:hypothetical protein